MFGNSEKSPKICRALVPGRTKYGSHYETRCTQKGTRKQSWFIQKIFSVGQNVTHTIQNEQTGLITT
jgi:hypothetical protein